MKYNVAKFRYFILDTEYRYTYFSKPLLCDFAYPSDLADSYHWEANHTPFYPLHKIINDFCDILKSQHTEMCFT
jgi:hypothetical protein